MEAIVQWLQGLGLGRYVEAFVQADIDRTVLPHLTEGDLEKLGVTLGHRKKLLLAIAASSSAPADPSPTGVPAAAASIAPEAERRHVTVMFSDLVGSTALSAALDPEDLREVIGRYHACVAETVARFDGFVAKYMGDGVLVYFGYPHAHEDDAEQAVRAGLALVGAVRDRETPERLKIRVGIATGLVVIGDLIGAGSAQEQAIVGETPNLAARLQALAEPNAVVIAEGTRRQIGGLFEVTDLGPQSLKGFAQPQHAWRVLAENRALGRFEALRSGATPLFGRDEEMELLLRRWAQAKAASGRVMLISAEPGIGKSRLTEALAERIAGEPHLRLRYFCSPHHQDSALYPIIAQMERAAGFARDDVPAEKLAKLRTVLAAAAPPIEDLMLLAELHALPLADLGPPLDWTPQRKKERTFEALLWQVEGLSRQQPVLMVFEDVHWIDPSSRELLDRTVERIGKWPVLLIASFRPEFQPPWTGQPHVTMLALTRLDRRDTAAMVENIAGNASLAAEIVEEIAERTDGVPLFVEELTKTVLESGAEGTAALSSVPHSQLSVPATLHASLMARLDRLGPAAKDVAQRGAVIGREFEHGLLASIADLPELQLRQALDRLTNSGLLFMRGTAPLASYIFKHALVQDAAYGTLLRGRRQQLHSRIAVALEDSFPEIVLAQPALLARHCAEAGLAEKAVGYWLKAGQEALARSAMTEAVAQLRKGLDMLAGLPDGSWRRQQELDLLIALRPALAGTKGWSATNVGETLARARMLAEQLDQPGYLVPLLHGQWGFHLVRSEHRLALSVARHIEEIGEHRNDVAVQLVGRFAHGATLFFLGEFVTARALLEGCLGFSDPAHRTIGAELSMDPYAMALAYLGLILTHLGYIGQARLLLNEALSEARRLGHAHMLANVISFRNWTDSLTRSPELQRHAEEQLSLATDRGGFPFYVAWGIVYRGRSLISLGQTQEGVALLTQGLAAVRGTETVLVTSRVLIFLADGYGMLGEPLEGLKCLAEAAQIIVVTDERTDEVELHRVRGDLLKVIGEQSAAEQSYREALAVAERQSAKLFELRAATSLARLWRNQGKTAEAQALLAPVYSWFTEGFDAPDLVEAKALLAELR